MSEDIFNYRDKVFKDLNTTESEVSRSLLTGYRTGIRYMDYLEKSSYELPDYQKKFELSRELINRDIGFVLIRPDMRHIDDNIISLLEKNNLNIIECTERTVDYSQYKKIYEVDLFEKLERYPRMLFTIPSRTLVYLAGNSKIVLFEKSLSTDEHSSDLVVRKLKGVEGKPQENTIRGDIVFNECLRLQKDEKLVDPFGMYNRFVKFNKKDLFHYGFQEELKILRYAGQGVHIPNKEEAMRDLAALLSLEEL